MRLIGDDFEKKLKSLPQDIQDAFFSDSVSQAILDIGKKYGLSIDKVGELGDEISDIMFGITPTGDFIKNLSERLGVDKEKARVIAEDVNQKIFQPIKASMRKVHGLPADSASVTPSVKEASPANIQAGKPEEPKTAPPAPTTSAPAASSTYVIPSNPAVVHINPPTPDLPAGEAGKRSDFPGKSDLKEEGKMTPASMVVVGDTKLNFAPLPIAKKPETKKSPDASVGTPTPPRADVGATPQIFAKKITPIDALLDKIDAGESVIKPKQKIDSVSLQLNPPPASGIKTMFRDAKTFLKRSSSPAGSEPTVPTSVQSSAPSAEPYVIPSKTPPVVAPTISAPPTTPETTTISVPPKISPTAPLNQQTVKSEIENALGGKIKLDPLNGEADANSIKDPYREPIE